jgi:hypothetical protein
VAKRRTVEVIKDHELLDVSGPERYALRKVPRLTASPSAGLRVQKVSDDSAVSGPSVRKALRSAPLTAT